MNRLRMFKQNCIYVQERKERNRKEFIYYLEGETNLFSFRLLNITTSILFCTFRILYHITRILYV